MNYFYYNYIAFKGNQRLQQIITFEGEAIPLTNIKAIVFSLNADNHFCRLNLHEILVHNKSIIVYEYFYTYSKASYYIELTYKDPIFKIDNSCIQPQ